MSRKVIEDIVYMIPIEPQIVSLGSIFGNSRPVELEIGCGKGGFLLSRARAHPDRNFLGIEWASKFFRYAADRMVRWDLDNVRMIRTDAKVFVARYLDTSSLQALHIYHPDPWPKKRHHKRRLIDPAFMATVCRVLAPGGTLAIQTDHLAYFQVICDVLNGSTALEQTLRAIQNDDGGEATVETNFQIKYRREGRPIYRLECVRTRDTVAAVEPTRDACSQIASQRHANSGS